MDSAFPNASTLEDVMAAAPEFAREIESAIARDDAASPPRALSGCMARLTANYIAPP
jgi:hypothetical protein